MPVAGSWSLSFHVHQPIILLTFSPQPSTPAEKSLHLLDVRRVLSYYVQRTASFRNSKRLFISPHRPHKGHQVSPQTISRWIVQRPYHTFDLRTGTQASSMLSQSPLCQSSSDFHGVSAGRPTSGCLQGCHLVHTIYFCIPLQTGCLG